MTLSLNQQIANAREELELLRNTNRRENLRSRLDMATLQGRKAALEREYERAKETAQQFTKMHVYADILRELGETNGVPVSNYVLYIEAQACRALHQMASGESQAKIQQTMYDDICLDMKTLIQKMKGEKGLCEHYFGLLHAKARKEQAKLKEKYCKKIQGQCQELTQLRARFPPQHIMPASSPVFEEEEEEEDAPHSMLMTILGRATYMGSNKRSLSTSLSPTPIRQSQTTKAGFKGFHMTLMSPPPLARLSEIAKVA